MRNEKLTAEEQNRLVEYRQQMFEQGWKHPTDRGKATESWARIRTWAGLPETPVLWLQDPMQARLLLAALGTASDAKLREHLGKQLMGRLWSQLWDQVGSQLWNSTQDQIGRRLWSQLDNHLYDQLLDHLGDQLYNQVGNHLRDQNSLQGQLRENLWEQLGNQIRDPLGEQLRDQLWNQLCYHMGNQIKGSLWNQLRDQLGEHLWSQFRNQFQNQIDDQLWSQLQNQPGKQLRDQLWNQIGDQLVGHIWNQVNDQLRTQLWNQIGDQLRGQFRVQLQQQLKNQLWDQIGNQIKGSLWDQIQNQLGNQIRGPLREQLTKTPSFHYFGPGELPWLAVYDFGRTVGADYGPELNQRLDDCLAFFGNVGCVYVYEGLTIFTDKPTSVRWSTQVSAEGPVLHCADGPAVAFAGGTEVYSWRGVRVPKDWIMSPESVNAELVLTHPQIEQRRALAEIVGWEKVLEKLSSKKISEDEYGVLYQAHVPDSGNERFVKVKCGTGRTFVLPVPMNMKTAHQAVAWTYGLKPEDYQLEVRT